MFQWGCLGRLSFDGKSRSHNSYQHAPRGRSLNSEFLLLLETDFTIGPDSADSPEMKAKNGAPKGDLREFMMKSRQGKEYQVERSPPRWASSFFSTRFRKCSLSVFRLAPVAPIIVPIVTRPWSRA
jgi:hypothetical protein